MTEHEAMTRARRVEARHWLRGVDHAIVLTYEALSPLTGMEILTVQQFDAGIDDIIQRLTAVRRHFGSGRGWVQEAGHE